MDIDPDISNWVLEFLLGQSIDDRALDSLLRTLPLPKNNVHLQKSILLKKLESDVSRDSISKNSIELLEQLEELEFQLGTEMVSDAMKHAYCAVVLECTAKHLPVHGDLKNREKFKFFRNVKRLWRGRIGRTEKVLGMGGLGSEELYAWKDNIEAAVWDDSVCERLVKKVKAVNAAEALSVYLREEREKISPSFLELVAERIKDDKFMQAMVGVGSVDRVDGREATSCHSDRNAKSDDGNGLHKEQVQLKGKLIGCKRSMEPSETTMGEKLADSDEVPIRPSYKNYKTLCSADVNRVREALDSSAMELRAVVKDPLPDALRLAEAISGPSRANPVQDPVQENCAESNMFIVGGDGVVQNAQPNVSADVRRSNLMERNSTAHIFEWTESTDELQGNLANRWFGIRLPSPKAINVTPLNIYKAKNLKARRRRRMWTTLEEDTLRTGVQIYGIGCWKDILTAYRDIFEDRTDGDLKDKWRNLSRH